MSVYIYVDTSVLLFNISLTNSTLTPLSALVGQCAEVSNRSHHVLLAVFLWGRTLAYKLC